MNIILYHANCADGFAAAFAAWLKFGDAATYIPVSYGQKLADVLPPPYCFPRVFILDFSFPREELESFADRWDVDLVTVLDHHKTAAQTLAGLPNLDAPESLCARFDMTKSGCVLAWEYFHPGKPVPEMLLYVQDRDLWKWEMPHSKEINAGIWRGTAREFGEWYFLLLNWNELARRECRTGGHAIVLSDAHMLATLAAGAEHVTPDPGGPLTLRVNSPVLQSELADKLLADDGLCEVVDVWWHAGGHRHHSLRSRPGGVDVSAIAARHGGGGHPAAAGYKDS